MFLLLCAGFPGVLAQQPAAAAPEAARVAQIITFKTSGQVTAAQKTEETTGGSSAAKKSASTATAGGTLGTAADASTAVMLGGLGTARMLGDTQVKVPAEAEGAHSLELLKGSLFMNIDAAELKKNGPAEFKLKTPAALLAVKGTRFFATTTQSGEELIGVHEGRVLVQNAADQKQVEITEGNVVPLEGGSLGEVRAMTSDEKATRTEYDLASLVREPAPTSSMWEELRMRRVVTRQKPVRLPDGNTRFTWPLGTTKSLTYLTTGFLYDITPEQARGVVALELRVRAIGMTEITFYTERPGRVPPVTIQPTNADWQTVVIAFPGYSDLHAAGYNEQLGIRLIPSLRFAGESLKKTGVMEIGPVQLLKEPP